MQVQAFIERWSVSLPLIFPEDFDAEKDRACGRRRPEISRVCCALDATPYVVDTGSHCMTDMLVVHHTPLWTTGHCHNRAVTGLMRALLSADMNLYVMHTNFDRAQEGVNDALAELLSLKDIDPMSTGSILDPAPCPLLKFRGVLGGIVVSGER